MRIVENTPGTLVVEESPNVFRAVLAGVIALLSYGLAHTWAENHWAAKAFMACFIALLMLFLVKTPTVRARFDKRGRVEITRRSLLGELTESYSFRHFKRARVEAHTDDGATYRVIHVFSEAMLSEIESGLRARRARVKQANGQPMPVNEVPFTDYLTSGAGPKNKAAEAINAWAGVADRS